MVNPLISSFIFHKRAHIQFKKLEQCGDWFFSLFLCDFTFNSYNILNMIFIFDVAFLGCLLTSWIYHSFKQFRVLHALKMGNWVRSSLHYSQQLAQSAVLCVFPASCWKKKIDVLNLFFYFSLVLILAIISSPNFSQCFR